MNELMTIAGTEHVGREEPHVSVMRSSGLSIVSDVRGR
jgi:hypothetical protein